MPLGACALGDDLRELGKGEPDLRTKVNIPSSNNEKLDEISTDHLHGLLLLFTKTQVCQRNRGVVRAKLNFIYTSG